MSTCEICTLCGRVDQVRGGVLDGKEHCQRCTLSGLKVPKDQWSDENRKEPEETRIQAAVRGLYVALQELLDDEYIEQYKEALRGSKPDFVEVVEHLKDMFEDASSDMEPVSRRDYEGLVEDYEVADSWLKERRILDHHEH